MLRPFPGDVLVYSICNIWIGSTGMGLGLGTNNEQLIGTLSSSALGQTHQYKQGLLWGTNQVCYSNLDTHDLSL